MAIGDTVNAGLMRVDFSPFLEAGRANADANASFGQALSQVAKGYIEGQEKKKRTNEIAGFLMGQGVSEKDAMAIAKNPFLQKEYQRKKEADVRKEIAGMQARSGGDGGLAQRKYEDAQEKERLETERQVKFANELLAETTNPAVQQNAEMARPGLFALGGDTEMRNRFLDAQIEQQPKTTVGNLGSEDFATVARETGMDPRMSANRFMSLQAGEVKQAQEELARQPKALSPSDQLAREKYEDQKAEDVEQTETAKIESTNNLTDFYNETKSLLDKINEKGVDVTGPIEGTSIYRFFSKLGDTDDEQVRRRLEMFTRKLTLDAAQNLKGALSDKDIRFLVEQAPDMDDNPSVWKKYMGDLVLRLERNANQQGIELGVPQANPSAPASQSILDEIERKKQLRSKRAGL